MAEGVWDDRPKALRYARALNAVEQMIVDALPAIVGKLVSMAKEGDVAASRYLVDRIFGRVPLLPAAPVVDKSLPYTHIDWANAQIDQRERRKAVEEVRERWSTERFNALFGGEKVVPPKSMPGVGGPPASGSPGLSAIQEELARRRGKGR